MSKKIVNYVTFLVDKSSSMQRFTHTLPNVYRKLLADIEKNSKAAGQTTLMRTVQFGSPVWPSGPVRVLGPFSETVEDFHYNPIDGSTALYDALRDVLQATPSASAHQSQQPVRGLQLIANQPPAQEDVAHLIVVLTDGEDNSSSPGSTPRVRELLKREDITVAIQVPSEQAKLDMIRTLGLDPANVQVWEQTSQGLERAAIATTSATVAYTAQRSAGLKKSTSFYATTDLGAGVDKTDLSQCENLTTKFRNIRVDKETRIDDFVRTQTGTYLRGTAYYQLTKPELIQSTKALMLRKKGTRTLYGGPKVREILGLPQYQDAKVNPGNHGEWDIFVQSNADNRKLVRGTDLVVVR